MIAITFFILLVTMLTILAVNVYLRNKKGKKTPYNRVLLCFHILDILLTGTIYYILQKSAPIV